MRSLVVMNCVFSRMDMGAVSDTILKAITASSLSTANYIPAFANMVRTCR